MKFPGKPRHPHPVTGLGTGALALLIPLAVGCASPGNPRPPTLNLSEVVTDLTAERIGSQVQLHWTTPSRTTDRLDVVGNLTAEVCRQINPTSSSAGAWVTVQRLSVHPGPTQTIDPLPQLLTADPAALVAYRIQIFNVAGRSAGPSGQAFAAAGTAPPTIAQLRATATKDGAVIEWLRQTSATPVASTVELDRVISSAPTPEKTHAQSAAKQPLQLTPPKPSEVHLQAGKDLADPGGTLDRTAQKGETYTYTAQRVRSVKLGGHTLELRSPKSIAVTMLLSDTFPPQVPTGLASVPGGTTSADRSIDLSWQPGAETDLAGYIVYRQEINADGQPQGPTIRLNQTPVVGPAFRDLTATPGHRYTYRVTAIDTAGNESQPSADVQEILREP
ncbi:MAG: hypothetical protein JWQ42_135 [Edaphobacter sp.]|nr:hypothetical protein [Edaphobacter sp.]